MISDHTPYNFPHGNGDPQRVFQRQNNIKTLARLSKRVGRCMSAKNCHAKGRELTPRIYSQLRWWQGYRRLRKISAVCSMHGWYSTQGTILSMLNGSRTIFLSIYWSAAQTHCARCPQLVSKKFLEKEIFVGTNFRELAFDRENRENFCLAKISRYTVC